jgi:HD-GYP domain-containing protein (c-di-GMP phosphodiesterase class II)
MVEIHSVPNGNIKETHDFILKKFDQLRRDNLSDWEKADVDHLFFDHMLPTATIARILAGYCGWKGDPLRDITFAALLHDIGKLEIPIAIVNKSDGKYTKDEVEIMKTHSRQGFDLTKPCYPEAALIMVAHHEFQDGGYPRSARRSGERHIFTKLQKILSLADGACACMEDRSYRKTLGAVETQNILDERFNNHKMNALAVNTGSIIYQNPQSL